MKEVKITCDNCGVDLTHTCNSIGYRIHLHSEVIPTHGEIVTDMMTYEPVGNHHFCSPSCMIKFISTKYK